MQIDEMTQALAQRRHMRSIILTTNDLAAELEKQAKRLREFSEKTERDATALEERYKMKPLSPVVRLRADVMDGIRVAAQVVNAPSRPPASKPSFDNQAIKE